VLGLPQLAGIALITVGATGCTFLDLLLGQGPGFDPGASFPIPSAAATFSSGSATIKLAAETIVLDELKSGGSVPDDIGVSAVWTNGQGWYLTFSGFPDVGFGAESSYLALNRIFDGQHWVTYDPTRCVTTTERANATGIQGSAICRGLEWSDFFSSQSGLGIPQEIEGQAAFDADITFEAH
jgi:hypothetical protein